LKGYPLFDIIKAGDIEIPVVPYEILILMKKATQRERDLIDVGYLELIRKKIRKNKTNGWKIHSQAERC
jgi:hypothetical protein